LYDVTVSDLTFFKSQQWSLTNYALLAFAVVVSIPFLQGMDIGVCGRFLLCSVASVVYVFSIVLLWRLKSSIKERRDRLDRVFEKFTKTFRDARGNKKQVSATEIFIFLGTVLTIGIGFVWWLVYVNKLLD